MLIRRVLGISVSCLIVCQALAQSDPSSSPLEIKGRVWAEYTADISKGGTGNNGFDITRAFLQTRYAFDQRWSALVLLDAVRAGTTQGAVTNNYLVEYLRNAYIEAAGVAGASSYVRFGLQPMLFISAVDSALKTRWLARSATDQASVVASQSGGLVFSAQALPWLRYGLSVHNGMEGLSKAGASDDGLAYGFFIGVKPWAGAESALGGLSILLYDEIQSRTSAVVRKNTLASAVTWESPWIDTGFELNATQPDTGSSQVGYGLTANVKFFEETTSLFVRYASGNDAYRSALLKALDILTVGPTYTFLKGKVMTGLLFETKRSTTTGASASNAVLWKAAANF